ncbi:sialic acid synthase SpsE [Desulfobaculum xiamenense]|uniref:Sialic acid synthase SpsE n=1 Tax=Desulfobaculum xiamenense TaxID=995050 RepID=A0A846QQZ0_9BACT|nr:N-acetylneuraminate synthase family protein [Desulfobaculum xiamenense]NJB67069.1 sialic acid synthase SpsE [Desulfobaculum xiamenense]
MRTVPFIRLPHGAAIGHEAPCFVIAEIGNNHQGDLDIARAMVRSAAEAGADAVKFQKRDNAALFTREGLDAPYTGPNSFGPTYGEHRRALELDFEQLEQLKRQAEALGMVFFASAWDMPSLDGLAAMGVELFKVASADLVNVPMLRRIAALGRPVLLSTGMSTLAEIDLAVNELDRSRTVLLHCNSSYPCPPEETAIPVMNRLRTRYGLPVGYSGHEGGIAPSLAAVAHGACVVERHFTLDRTMRGTDHTASLDPAEFAHLVLMIRETEAALRITDKRVFEAEARCAAKLRKSIVAARNLTAGTMLTESDITVRCPGTGISPAAWDEVIGRVLVRDIAADGQLAWDAMLAKQPLRAAAE